MIVLKLFDWFVLGVHQILALPLAVTYPDSRNPHHKYYALILIVSIVYLTLWQLSGKSEKFYASSRATIVVLDASAAVLIAVFAVYDTISRTFVNDNRIRIFFAKLRKIDKFLNIPHVPNYFMKGVAIHRRALLGIHFIFLATVSYDVYSNPHFAKYNSPNFVLKYQIMWFIVHLHMVATALRTRFGLINRKFLALIRNPSPEVQAVGCMKYHFMLCDVITNINKTYSFQILIIDKIIAVNVVKTSYLCLLSVTDDQAKFSIAAFVTNFLWSVDFMLGAALICFSLGKANEQAEFPVVMCQNLYKEFRGDEERREILMHFSRQVVATKREFCALGFLPVNYGLFVKMLTSIFDYIIIVMQFEE